jgi:hypothetical protein
MGVKISVIFIYKFIFLNIFSEMLLRCSEGKENKNESSGAATDWTNVVVVTADGKTWTLFLVR